MIYCFDTSALNRLLDDPERDVIMYALINTPSLLTRITAYNLIEAIATPNTKRRNELVYLMKRLAKDQRPLDRPGTIACSVAKAFAAGENRISINTDPNLEGLWIALNQPDLIDDSHREECAQWSKEWMDEFDSIVYSDRHDYQELFSQSSGMRPLTVGRMLRVFLRDHKKMFWPVVKAIYEKETGKALTESGYNALRHDPHWRLLLASYMYGLHQRSVKVNDYGKKKNAGGIDLSQAVYLPSCNRFVTADRAHYRAMRVLNQLNKKRHTEVLQYSVFRQRLFAV